MEYLIDTDWRIDFLKNAPAAIQLLEPLLPSRAAISVVTLGELYDGAFGSHDPSIARERLEQAFRTAVVIAVDVETAIIFGRLRSELRRTGQSLPDNDLADRGDGTAARPDVGDAQPAPFRPHSEPAHPRGDGLNSGTDGSDSGVLALTLPGSSLARVIERAA